MSVLLPQPEGPSRQVKRPEGKRWLVVSSATTSWPSRPLQTLRTPLTQTSIDLPANRLRSNYPDVNYLSVKLISGASEAAFCCLFGRTPVRPCGRARRVAMPTQFGKLPRGRRAGQSVAGASQHE